MSNGECRISNARGQPLLVIVIVLVVAMGPVGRLSGIRTSVGRVPGHQDVRYGRERLRHSNRDGGFVLAIVIVVRNS